MIKRLIIISAITCVSFGTFAQKSKINAAWRSFTDYQSTQKEKPEFSYLTKAKESIDAAAANEETKNNPKMHEYRTKIYYEIFKFNLNDAETAQTSVSDKNARKEAAYANVSTKEFMEAAKSLEYIQKNVKDQSVLQEVTNVGLQMLSDLNNL